MLDFYLRSCDVNPHYISARTIEYYIRCQSSTCNDMLPFLILSGQIFFLLSVGSL